MRALATIAFLCGTALTAIGATDAADAVKAKPVVSITLPGDLAFDYKKGPGQAVAQTYCLTCHSSAYVSMQPQMNSAQWTKEVTKMRKVYGAVMTDAEAATVADYLGKEYGPPAP